MTRSLPLFFVLSLALAGCPSNPDPVDAGLDAGGDLTDTGGVDAPRLDGGRDGGSDAGSPIACTGADCAIVEIDAFGATSCARRMNGDVICWGQGQEGQLGDGRESHPPGCPVPGEPFPIDCSSGPVLVALADPATEVFGQAGEVCARVGTGGEYWCWGEGNFNIGTVVPTRNFAPIRIPVLDGATEVALAQSSWCWLDDAGDPFCIGSNGVGQLGDGSRSDRVSPVAVMLDATTGLSTIDLLEIDAGTYSGTACARSADTLYCWGANESGQLGDGIDTHFDCGGGATLRDCSLVAVPVAIDATMVAEVAIGGDHVCARMTDGTLQCWGENVFGQLGTGDTATRRMPTVVPGIDDAVSVVARGPNTCVVHATGEVSCWGRSNLGQVGDGETSHTSGVCGGATIVDCQLTPATVMGIDDAVEVSLSFEHACALRASGEVWCWGNNERFQLGDGTRMVRYAPVRVPFLP